jgi:hypothetical protein
MNNSETCQECPLRTPKIDCALEEGVVADFIDICPRSELLKVAAEIRRKGRAGTEPRIGMPRNGLAHYESRNHSIKEL